jgi:hypothetical protein
MYISQLIKLLMRNCWTIIPILIILATVSSCRKEKETGACLTASKTVRTITDKAAVIKLTATVNGVYILEQGSTEQLIPCNFPMEFYQNDLQVTISGNVKSIPQGAASCCTENFVITTITR